MKHLFATGALLLGSLASVTALAQPTAEEAAAAVQTRQGLFHVLAFSNSPLGLMARGAEFDQEAALAGIDRVAMLAELIPEVFAVDTSAADIESRSAQHLWQSKSDFDNLAFNLRDGALAARKIIEEQGAAGVRNAVREIGPKCGACHDRYRLDK